MDSMAVLPQYFLTPVHTKLLQNHGQADILKSTSVVIAHNLFEQNLFLFKHLASITIFCLSGYLCIFICLHYVYVFILFLFCQYMYVPLCMLCSCCCMHQNLPRDQ